MNKEIRITKIESARRQLESAVILYFNDKDPISIHTLVCAAHEIIAKLNRKQGGAALIMEGSMIKKEYQNEFRREIRKAKNFFKHADSDPDESLVFNPDNNDYYLLDACEGYELLTGEKNSYFVIYRGWFISKYPHILNTVSGQLIRNKFINDKLKYFTNMIEASVQLQ